MSFFYFLQSENGPQAASHSPESACRSTTAPMVCAGDQTSCTLSLCAVHRTSCHSATASAHTYTCTALGVVTATEPSHHLSCFGFLCERRNIHLSTAACANIARKNGGSVSETWSNKANPIFLPQGHQYYPVPDRSARASTTPTIDRPSDRCVCSCVCV